MDYFCVYWRLINRAKTRDLEECGEFHHIIPRSEGGSNKKTNKVELTPKEHHLCHLCLIKMRSCLKYCFRHLTLREYMDMKMKEKAKLNINNIKRGFFND